MHICAADWHGIKYIKSVSFLIVMIHINLLSDLSERVKNNALEELQRNPKNFFYYPFSSLRGRIAKLYAEHVISEPELDAALEQAVLKTARQDYEFLTGSHNHTYRFADHLPIPEILAYGVQKGLFTGEEISKIPFDHGMTAASFCDSYLRQSLFEKLKKDLLKPRSRMLFDDEDDDFDPHPACCP